MQRPLLKGVFHLMAFIVYFSNISFFLSMIPAGLEIPLILYLSTIICNFGFSALLHMISWSGDKLTYMRRIDHTIIFLLIAATYYAGISTIMHDINHTVIYVLSISITLGIITRLLFTDISPIIIGFTYLPVGWAILLDPYILIEAVKRTSYGSIIGILGGISYTLGAYIYITKSPKLWPKYMGYHELFHVSSIIGTSLFVIYIFGYGIPYHIDKFRVPSVYYVNDTCMVSF